MQERDVNQTEDESARISSSDYRLTVSEVAEHIGYGPASFAMGRKVFYRRSDVENWIDEQEQPTRRGGSRCAACYRMMRDNLLLVYAGRALANFTTGTIESMLRPVAVERGGSPVVSPRALGSDS